MLHTTEWLTITKSVESFGKLTCIMSNIPQLIKRLLLLSRRKQFYLHDSCEVTPDADLTGVSGRKDARRLVEEISLRHVRPPLILSEYLI